MSSTVEVLDPIADPRWLSFVQDSPSALVFHHPAWISLLRDVYGYEMRAWVVVQDGTIVGGLPVALVASRLTGRRLVSLPFCDRCGPIMAAASPDGEVAQLYELIVAQQHRAGIPLHVHDQLPALADASCSERFRAHTVALADDPAEVQARFTKSSVMRGARKAQKLGLRVERRTDPAALEAFYALHLETRRHQGVPIQSKRFIRRFATLFAQGLGHVALVVEEPRQHLAAAVFLTFNGALTYKYGASNRAALGKRPNNLLFVDAIQWGCAQGLRQFDLGRTDFDNQGLRDFKLSLGATERELSYTWISERPAPVGRSGVPAPLQAAIRRGPPILGRGVGRALYRHIA